MNASHLKANDLIIHFGKCCLSTGSKVSAAEWKEKEIVYVVPQGKLLDWVRCAEEVNKAAAGNAIYLMLDLEYETQTPEVLAAFGSEVSVGQIDRIKFNIIPARPAEEIPAEGEVILGKTFRNIAGPG